MRWASRHSTSTATAGWTLTSPTIRTRARCIATTATGRSPTSARRQAAPTATTAGRRPAWVWPSATTTAAARWTSSRPTSPATPPRCTRNTGDGLCEDRTLASGIGVNSRWLGWGVGFVDLDGDGWLDLLLANGHVYPEVDRLESEAGYRQPKVVYRNLRNGRFADVSARLGAAVRTPKAGRGVAFADFDNDGDVDVVVNNLHEPPDLLRLDRVAPAALADAEARGHAVEPQRDRCAGARGVSQRRAAGGSYAAAEATTRKATCGSTSPSATRRPWTASSSAGRPEAKKSSPLSPSTGCTLSGNDRRCPFAVSLGRRRATCRRTCDTAARPGWAR